MDFILKSPLPSVFVETWLYRGNYKYHVDHDPAAASQYYRKAVSFEPSFIDPWIALARTEIDQGNVEQARRTLEMISPAIANVSTWKMDQLRFAFELRDEKAFGAYLNYILIHLPNHVQEAGRLGSEFWGGWESLVAHVSSQGSRAFLDELMRLKETDAAILLWERIIKEAPPPEEKLRLRFCQFLMDCGRLREAKIVWRQWKGDGNFGVYDGGFEFEPLNTAFGWRLEPTPDFLIEHASGRSCGGGGCLHLRFSGKKNLFLDRVLQVIPVEPGRDCRLKFAEKAQSLTTDQGVFLEVDGCGCEGLHAQSTPLTGGTAGWIEEDLELQVPKECEAIALKVRRNESLKFDCDISGDFWLEKVEIH